MAIQADILSDIAGRVAGLRRGLKGQQGWPRAWTQARLWTWMLYHEFLRDNVNVRAQALAYLTLFSLLPLLAGVFFVFAFFARFGMVQDAVQRLIENFLGNIPLAHRDSLREYVFRFKDSYLENITQTSSSVGVFAVLVLAWVGLQAFNNLDSTLNEIWSVERERAFLEKARNFLVVAVLAPMVLIAGFSVPLILDRVPVTNFFLQTFPVLRVLLNHVIPWGLLAGTFFCMYRFLPFCRVKGKSAAIGAACSLITLAVVNSLMGLYFAFGTNSAYGKAAAVPLVGFWIYALWIVVIMGAEVSFLVQNGKEIGTALEQQPSLSDGRSLLTMLLELHRAYAGAEGAVTFERLREIAGIDTAAARRLLDYLERTQMVAETLSEEEGGCYVLARSVEKVYVADLLREFYRLEETKRSGIEKQWQQGIGVWLKSFERVLLTELAAPPPPQI